jgi:flagellar biosynthesis/type III secretory pathway chaperone
MSKKVAIVGFAPSTRDLAPYNNDEWEIWVLNEFESILPQGGATNITRWFEIHQRETVLNSKRDSSYMDKLKNSKIPIMMCQKHEDIPMSEEYPLNDIIQALGTDYFTNSISYMVAYAVYMGYEEIAIYGVDMAQDEEYAKERPSVEYFVGFARAKGIPVYIPPESDICKAPYYYGFQEESASKICRTIDPKKDDLVKRMNSADFSVDEMLEHIDYNLKKYLFDVKPLVEKERALDRQIAQLVNELNSTTDEEKRKEIATKINQLQENPIPIRDTLFPADSILTRLWECNQALKGSKKERLYLAGASDISHHLRKILCPFD